MSATDARNVFFANVFDDSRFDLYVYKTISSLHSRNSDSIGMTAPSGIPRA